MIWDADGRCEKENGSSEHIWTETEFIANKSGGVSKKQKSNVGAWNPNGIISKYGFCRLCNAWRGCLGLEPTPELYIQHMVEIFRELRRVLRSDGTLWLNMGDSYSGSGGSTGHTPETKNLGRKTFEYGAYPSMAMKTQKDLPSKNLLGIPWRVALALQADGWWLRSDIIWHKPNPMPESVTDRPTKAHEYLFLLSKNQKYYYDADAIREPHKEPWRSGKKESNNPHSGRLDDPNKEQAAFTVANREYNPLGRNKRTVWTIPTKPFPQAHFATFPPALIEPCILAGCPKDGTVLDPFLGSGTTGIVARNHGRKFIGIELSKPYLDDIAIPRIEKETEQRKLFK